LTHFPHNVIAGQYHSACALEHYTWINKFAIAVVAAAITEVAVDAELIDCYLKQVYF
jgi:hypothetical protein